MPTPQFYQLIEDLTDQAYAQGRAAGTPGIFPRPWNVPTTFPSSVDPADPVGFVTACDRSEANDKCIEVYQNGNRPGAGRVGQVMALKKAIDYHAAYERALHARFASSVRCRVWSAARKAGHGDKNYGVFAAVVREIDQTYAAGTATEPLDPANG